MSITPTGERQLLDGPQEEEVVWTYHALSPELVEQAKLHGLTVTAPCGYTFQPRTPPAIDAPAAPGGALFTVRMEKCPDCVRLDPRFARQQELWQVSL